MLNLSEADTSMVRAQGACHTVPRVLVVEDSYLVAMALEQSLQLMGCEVVGPVGQVARAVDLASREPLDGAILDVNLAGETVFPVVEELQARRIPFILASGYDAAVLPDRFRSVPRLKKPFDARKLEEMVRSVFGCA